MSLDKRPICVVTNHGTENYGSNMQAIGLRQTLQKMNYRVYFLKRFFVKDFFIKHPMLLFSRIANRLVYAKKAKQFFIPVTYDVSIKRKERLEHFSRAHFDSIPFENKEHWEKAIADNMIFVAGSDIIWNPARGFPTMYFLDFAYYAKLNRFSYASSIGAPELPRKFYPFYKKYLGSMSAVSVREESVTKMLEPIINKKVTKVVDPTLLLTAQEWGEFADKAEVSVTLEPKGFVLCYFVMDDPRYWEYVRKIAEETGMQIVVLPMHHNDEQQPYDIVYDGTPYEFTWLIKNAEFICTDSFHACVFSFIFQKEFYLLKRTRASENAKYDDFFNRYHLSERCIVDESVFVRNKNIDYSFANQQLKIDRENSLAFLHDVLEEMQ